MDREPYKPVGYCPHCGYAIDPGTCPECGNAIAAGELDSSPYWVTRRRRIKRTLWSALAVACVVGGVWLYRTPSIWAPCLPYVPTRVLLLLQGDEGSPTMTELVRRLNTGALTQAEADKMLDQVFTVPEGLTIRSPHPRDVEMQLGLALVRKADWGGWSLRPEFSEVRVDGMVVPWIHDRPTRRDWRYFTDARGVSGIRLDSLIGPLAVGEHEVSWRIVLSLKPHSAPAGIPIPTWSKTLFARVRVEDRALDQFVRPVVDAAIAEQMRHRIGLVIGSEPGDDSSPNGCVEIEEPPVGLAAGIRARSAGTREFGSYGTVLCFQKRSIHDVILRLAPDDTLSVGSVVDVRLVPDPMLAFHAGLEQYFGGVIEWEGVIVKDQRVQDLTARLKSGLYLPPTRVSTSPTPTTQQ